MTALEIVSIGGTFFPSLSHLKPKPVDQYDGPIREQLERLQYTIAPNGLDIFVNFVSGTNRLFYSSRRNCERADVSDPALHFFKSELPSYEPDSDNTEICTARIAFRDNWRFYNYTSGLSNLPAITAISTWQEDGQSLFHNHTTSLELSQISGQEFVFACVEYKCSSENTNMSFIPTTVYLDIKIPNITYSYNHTAGNGSVVTENYTVPAFYCYGKCDGPLCRSQGQNLNGKSIDGSFTAPYIISTGADFQNTTQNTCRDRLEPESFAYEFSCHNDGEGF